MRNGYLKSDLAKDLGVSPGRVSQLLRAGMPSTLGAARAWRAARLDGAKTKREDEPGPRQPDLPAPAGADAEQFGPWRARRERAEALRSERLLEREQGRYIPLTQLALLLASASRQEAAILEAVPVKLRRRVPDLSPRP